MPARTFSGGHQLLILVIYVKRMGSERVKMSNMEKRTIMFFHILLISFSVAVFV